MIGRSVSEVSATVLKAARAGGVPLAQAEDIARAVVFLPPEGFSELPTALQPPSLQIQYTDIGDGLTFTSANIALAGPAALDAMCSSLKRARLESPDAPLLLQALVALANHDGFGPFSLSRVGASFELKCVGAICEIREPVTRISLPRTIWSQLETLAAETYVPATHASRLTGAGAGLTDND